MSAIEKPLRPRASTAEEIPPPPDVPPPPEFSPEEEQRLIELQKREAEIEAIRALLPPDILGAALEVLHMPLPGAARKSILPSVSADPAELLACAVMMGIPQLVSRLIEIGAPTTARTPYGASCLTLAIAGGKLEIARQLIEYDRSLLRENLGDGTTPLMVSMLHRDPRLFDLLMAYDGHDFSAQRHDDGSTALHLAVRAGTEGKVNAILQKAGSDELASKVDRFGATPLSIAVECGWSGVVRSLRPWAPKRPCMARHAQSQGNLIALTGDRHYLDRGALRVAAGAESARLQCLGDGDRGVSWEEFMNCARANATPGARWVLEAHGSEVNPAAPRHTLAFNGSDLVPTNDAIRVLVENGVRRIDVWSCHAAEAAAGLAARLRGDPFWPRMRDGEELQVTFHGETLEPSSTVAHQNERMQYVEAHFNETWEQAEALSLSTRTTVTAIDGRVDQVAIQEADIEELARRLPNLSPLNQGRVIGNFMLRCCVMKRAEALRDVMTRFPHLADPNFIVRMCAARMIESAVPSPEVIKVLLDDERTSLEALDKSWPLLKAAVSIGQRETARLLLADGRTTQVHFDKALSLALSLVDAPATDRHAAIEDVRHILALLKGDRRFKTSLTVLRIKDDPFSKFRHLLDLESSALS